MKDLSTTEYGMDGYCANIEHYQLANTVNAWAEKIDPKQTAWEWGVFTSLLPSGRILEVGPGGGRTARSCREAGFEYYGVDISRLMLRAASEHSEVPLTSFECLDLGTTSIEKIREVFPVEFDGIWCRLVLHHLPATLHLSFLKKLRVLIRKGGVMMISVSGGKGRGDKETREVRGGRKVVSRTMLGMIEELEKAGFRIHAKETMQINYQEEVVLHHKFIVIAV